MLKPKRAVEVVVISDVHLGTYGCHAAELLAYLKSIKPRKLILNGDIIDIWQFSKSYWPADHMKVIKHLAGLIAKGVEVTYITGNHDEMLRKFVGFRLGSFCIENKLVLELNHKSAWIFHGDVFDVTMQHSKWLAKLGGKGYDLLIVLNQMVNYCNKRLKRGKVHFSKNVKNRVKSAVKFINNFEQTCADLAVSSGYDYVVCGHIHQPECKVIETKKGVVSYLNSGDWVENLTALEFNNGQWQIYRYLDDKDLHSTITETTEDDTDPLLSNSEVMEKLMVEFQVHVA